MDNVVASAHEEHAIRFHFHVIIGATKKSKAGRGGDKEPAWHAPCGLFYVVTKGVITAAYIGYHDNKADISEGGGYSSPVSSNSS